MATSAAAAAAAALVGSAPLSNVTVAPTCAARAVIASSGATGLGHGLPGPPKGPVAWAQTLPALIPFVGTFDAVGPMTAIVLVDAVSGSRLPSFLSSTELS